MRLFKKNTLLKHSQIPSHKKFFILRLYDNFFGSFHVRQVSKKNLFIEPDEIFIDSSNLPNFDTDQFEGRIEKPISRTTIYITGGIFLTIGILFIVQSFKLQMIEGKKWSKFAENNRLNKSLIFSERGVIQDRNGVLLAWNQIDETQGDYPLRKYRENSGTHNLIGYVKYPKKDKFGFYYNTEYAGADGVESFFESLLKGGTGLKLTETDVKGGVISENVMRPAQKGANITLTIDTRVQEFMYDSIKEISQRSGFIGGAGMITDLYTGEVIASVSYPEYDSNVMTAATNTAQIRGYLTDKGKPFLNRISQGLYAPGSIVKPMFALAALQEQIISPDKQIESTGELRLPNPFRPGEYSIFKDWKAHGFTDMRRAIAVSSDVYFYQIGGGYLNEQRGLGIKKIDEYSKMFGLGEAVTSGFFKGKAGVIPTPEWKAINFKGDIWRVGDTYNTSIGQYGYQITPTQAIRAMAVLSNGGIVIDFHIFKSISADKTESEISPNISSMKISEKTSNEVFQEIDKSHITAREAENTAPDRKILISNPEYYRIVNEGMRMAVTEGTMRALDVPFVKIAGKTGTAQVGVNNEFINSWVTGVFPYEKPKYAFLIMMERGPSNLIYGATAAMVELIGKMNLYTSEYFKVN